MINGFNDKVKQRDDTIVLVLIILAVIFVIWLLLPPRDKFAQISFYCHKLEYSLNKDTRTKLEEVFYYRNQGVYYAQINREKASMIQLNKAISLASGFVTNEQMAKLYRDRAIVKLYFSDYKGALNDYLKADSTSIVDNLTIAQLLKKNGNRKLASSYCNNILVIDDTAYSGYACLADLYADAGRYDVAVKVYDLYLDKAKNKAQGLADRSFYKSKMGDSSGSAADILEAKSISPHVSTKISILEEALNPKLNLPLI